MFRESAVDCGLQCVVIRFTIRSITLNRTPSTIPAGQGAYEIRGVEACRSAISAGGVKVLRISASGGGPSGQRLDGVKIDAALVELIVRYVADIGDIHHKTLADIALDAESPVISGRRLHIERSRGGRLRRVYHGRANEAVNRRVEDQRSLIIWRCRQGTDTLAGGANRGHAKRTAIENAEAGADCGLAVAEHIPSQTYPRSEFQGRIVEELPVFLQNARKR